MAMTEAGVEAAGPGGGGESIRRFIPTHSYEPRMKARENKNGPEVAILIIGGD